MKISYARVSTLEQNPNLQQDALESAGCEKVIVDQVSGTVAHRPGLEKMGFFAGPLEKVLYSRFGVRNPPKKANSGLYPGGRHLSKRA